MSEHTVTETSVATIPRRACAACGEAILPTDSVAPGRRSYHLGCHSARDREWRQTDEGRASRAATYANYAARHPERRAARAAVRAQVKRGLWLPSTCYACVSCGAQARQYDHAHGYAPKNWLNVEPVCIPCHRARKHLRREYRGQDPDRAQVGPVLPELLAEYIFHRDAYMRAVVAQRAAFRVWLAAQREQERLHRETSLLQ